MEAREFQKNLKKVGGVSLVEWSIIHAKYISNKNDCIIVTSDSKDILQIAREMGVIDLHRPDSLSSDEVFTEPVMEHALEKYSPKNDDLIVFTSTNKSLKKKGDFEAIY